MSPPDLQALRRLTRAAFGQAYRLEVMLAVADSEDGLVTQTDLARTLGVSVSNAQAPVASLIDCGLLTRIPQGGLRSKFLLRNPSAAWTWAPELRDRALAADVAHDLAAAAQPADEGRLAKPRDVRR